MILPTPPNQQGRTIGIPNITSGIDSIVEILRWVLEYSSGQQGVVNMERLTGGAVSDYRAADRRSGQRLSLNRAAQRNTDTQ